MKTKDQILKLIHENRILGQPSFFLNGKKMSLRKIQNVIKSNVSDRAKFDFRGKKLTLPWYKGDYNYYTSDHGGKCRLKKHRFYITVING